MSRVQLLLITVVVLFVSAGIVAWSLFDLSKFQIPSKSMKESEIIPSPTAQKLKEFPQAKIAEAEGTIDLLTLPGWNTLSTFRLLPNGTATGVSPKGTTQMKFYNRNDYLEVNEKGITIRAKVDNISAISKKPLSAGFFLANRPYHETYLELYFTIEPKDNNHYLLHVSLQNFKATSSAEIATSIASDIPLSGNDVTVEVSGTGNREEWKFIDGATGQILKEAVKLPIPFFTQESGNKLFFGLLAASGRAGQEEGSTLIVQHYQAKKK